MKLNFGPVSIPITARSIRHALALVLAITSVVLCGFGFLSNNDYWFEMAMVFWLPPLVMYVVD